MRLIILFLFTLISLNFNAQNKAAKSFLRDGVKEYKNDEFKKAEIQFRKAIDKKSDYRKARYNLANSLYRNQDFESAIQLYNELTLSAESNEEKAELFYNIGNSFLKQEKYTEAIEAYKTSLLNNPNDEDAKYNLMYAKSKLSKQEQDKKQEQQKQNQQQEQQQNQQEQENQKQEENQDQNQSDKDNDNQNNDKNQDQNQNQEQEQNKKSRELTKEEAERLLKALQQKEKDLNEKLNEKKSVGTKSEVEKDW